MTVGHEWICQMRRSVLLFVRLVIVLWVSLFALSFGVGVSTVEAAPINKSSYDPRNLLPDLEEGSIPESDDPYWKELNPFQRHVAVASWKWYRSRGYNPEVVAGLLGSMAEESGLGKHYRQIGGGGGCSYYQWDDRRRRLLAYMGLNPNDMEECAKVPLLKALEFGEKEMDGNDPAVPGSWICANQQQARYHVKAKDFRTLTDVDLAAQAWCICFERPAAQPQPRRTETGIKLLNILKNVPVDGVTPSSGNSSSDSSSGSGNSLGGLARILAESELPGMPGKYEIPDADLPDSNDTSSLTSEQKYNVTLLADGLRYENSSSATRALSTFIMVSGLLMFMYGVLFLLAASWDLATQAGLRWGVRALTFGRWRFWNETFQGQRPANAIGVKGAAFMSVSFILCGALLFNGAIQDAVVGIWMWLRSW